MPIQRTSTVVARADLGDVVGEFDPSTEGFIARQILPPRETPEKSGKITAIVKENLGRVTTDHANGAAFNRANFATGEVSYACVEHALEGAVTQEDRALAMSEYDAEEEVTLDVNRKILVEREIRVATAVFNTTTFTGATLYTDNSASPWDTVTTTVIVQVNAAKEKVRTLTGSTPDTMILSSVQLGNLLANTTILARFPGAAVITEADLRANLAAIFGLKNLLVGEAMYNSANQGQDFVGADIWSDDYAMICKLNDGSLRSGGLGRTMIWTGMDSVGESAVETYEEPQTDSTIVRVREYSNEVIFDASFGHLLKIDA